MNDSSSLRDGQTMLGIFWSGFCGICTYTCIGNSIKVCPISDAKVVTWGPHVYIAVARCSWVTFYYQFDLRMVLFNKITLGVSGSVMEKLSAQWRAKEGR